MKTNASAARAASVPFALLVCLLLLIACDSPSPTPTTPQRLPTRILPTPTLTPTPVPVPAWNYYREGLARQEVGDLEGALRSFNWAIQSAPNFALAHVARGTVYLAQGEPSSALQDADAALEANPTSAPAHALRGEALRLLGRERQALEALNRALTLDPDLRLETFRSRWLATRAAGYSDRLFVLSREYADAYPDDPLLYYYKAWAFVELGRPRTASRVLIDGVEAAADPPALFWFALGEAYALERNWQEAVTAYEAARVLVQTGDTSLTLHSDRPIADLFGALGRAYLRANRCADAEVTLQYALDIGAPSAVHTPLLEEAHLCQTPTPIPTETPYVTTTPS